MTLPLVTKKGVELLKADYPLEQGGDGQTAWMR